MCGECSEIICFYQKDGAGNLLRLYLDRIIDARCSLSEKALRCPNGHMLGVRIVYSKENRNAFRLISHAVRKGVVSDKI